MVRVEVDRVGRISEPLRRTTLHSSLLLCHGTWAGFLDLETWGLARVEVLMGSTDIECFVFSLITCPWFIPFGVNLLLVDLKVSRITVVHKNITCIKHVLLVIALPGSNYNCIKIIVERNNCCVCLCLPLYKASLNYNYKNNLFDNCSCCLVTITSIWIFQCEFYVTVSWTMVTKRGKFFYLQLELLCLQLSLFAYTPWKPLLDALSHNKQKATTVSKKAKTAVSKKRHNCKQKS